MHRPLVALAVASALAAAAATSGPAARGCAGCAARASVSGPTFVFSGRGWGHGVGMSQYGALGFARRGTPYTRILAHYYPGTQLVRGPAMQVRVLIAEGRSSLTLASAAPFRVRDATGEIHRLDPGQHRLGPALKLKTKGGKKPQALPGPLAFMPGSMPLQLRRPYRGWIQVSTSRNKLQAINVVGLEAYLYGVVPDEVPDTWPAEALKAQAVAARSYALATRKTGGAFDLYSDTRSQVYGGVNAESFTTTAAVDATAGQVLTYRGRPAVTYFFSTSGGRTAAIQDAWPGARPVPYLVSVPDPYDSLSPYHRWGPVSFSARPLVRRLRLPAGLLDLRATRNGSGRVTSVVAVASVGQISVSGSDVRRSLGLRSTWFRIGVLSLSSPPGPAVYGTPLKLTGVARGLGGAALEERVAGSGWKRASRVSPASDGSVSVSVKPTALTDYRLAAGHAVSGSIRVAVAPLVRFFVSKETGSLRGMVRPILPRTAVRIERLAGDTWKLVESLEIDAKGNFEPKAPLSAGTFRARVSPGRGFVTGTSPVLKVVSP